MGVPIYFKMKSFLTVEFSQSALRAIINLLGETINQIGKIAKLCQWFSSVLFNFGPRLLNTYDTI